MDRNAPRRQGKSDATAATQAAATGTSPGGAATRGPGAEPKRTSARAVGGTTRHVDAWLSADAHIDRLIAKGKLG